MIVISALLIVSGAVIEILKKFNEIKVEYVLN